MTIIAADRTASHLTGAKADFVSLGRFALIALAPLAVLGGVNYAAETANVMPLFFSPAGLPGWAGAAIHLGLLLSVGVAIALVAQAGRQGMSAAFWGAAFALAMIVFPYMAAPLDSFALAIVMTLVLLVGVAASIRMTRISSAAGWLMIPSLAWTGLGAALGLAVAAAWSPPFALINAQNSAPPAA